VDLQRCIAVRERASVMNIPLRGNFIMTKAKLAIAAGCSRLPHRSYKRASGSAKVEQDASQSLTDLAIP